MAALQGDYQFSSEPRAVKVRNSKYREPDQAPQPVNVMHDKRVVRGNTYAAMIIPSNAPQEPEKAPKKRTLNDDRQKQASEERDREIRTPDPVDGRQHIDVQTENMPEELSDKPREFEIETQTDYLMDRPPTPLFMPKKIGEDVLTQVEDGELFDFDVEVSPILEVLITKSLEQGRMEVLEEEELDAMRKHQREFEQKRNAKLIEVQRLEAEELRRRDEAERRKVQARTRKEQLQFAHKKYLARILAKKYLSRLEIGTVTILRDAGVYSDPREVAFHDQLIPWLCDESLGSLIEENSAAKLLTEIYEEAVKLLINEHKQAVAGEYARRHEIRENEIKSQQENEATKLRRIELRIIRQREREINALRAKIEDKIIQAGAVVENITHQVFSDIDGRQSVNIIGTPGGLFGELLQFISAIEEATDFKLGQDQINLIIYDFLLHCLKSPTLIYSNISAESFAEFIKTFGKPSLSHQNIHLASDDIKSKILSYLHDPQNANPRTSLSLLWEHANEYGIREGLYEELLAAFYTALTAKDADAAHPNPLRSKVELKPTDLPAEGNEIALIKICIPKRLHDQSLGDELKEPQSPKEIELHDRILMVNPTNEELSVFVVHQTAQRQLRTELCQWIRAVKGYDNVDVEKLKDILNKRTEQRESKLLSKLCGNLPVFDFESN